MNAPGGGAVVLIGRPNVGKSTLLNHLAQTKRAIVSPVPQTTRNVIEARCEAESQTILFLDTPGIHRPHHLMNRRMVRAAFQALRSADLAVVLIDAEAGIGGGDRFVIREVADTGLPALLACNKIDRIRKSRLLPLIETAAGLASFAEIVPISAQSGENCDLLLAAVRRHLPAAAAPLLPPLASDPGGPPDADEDSFRIAETIREQVLLATRQELPHSTAVLIERIEVEGGATWIHATLAVEKDSQKKILIGRQGHMLRDIGTAARLELEAWMERKIVLKLWVRAIPDWRGDDRLLNRIGLPGQ